MNILPGAGRKWKGTKISCYRGSKPVYTQAEEDEMRQFLMGIDLEQTMQGMVKTLEDQQLYSGVFQRLRMPGEANRNGDIWDCEAQLNQICSAMGLPQEMLTPEIQHSVSSRKQIHLQKPLVAPCPFREDTVEYQEIQRRMRESGLL